MKTRLYARPKGREKDGKSTVQVIVRHKNVEMFFSSGVAIDPENFDKETGIKKKTRLAAIERNSIALFKQTIDRCLLALQLEGKLQTLTPKQLRSAIEIAIHGTTSTGLTFSALANQFIQSREKEQTRRVYRQQLGYALLGLEDDLIENITKKEANLMVERIKEKNNSKYTLRAAIYFATTVFNYGIQQEITDRNPFMGIPRPKIKTRNRDLTLEELATLKGADLTGADLTGAREWARDMFFLSFYLRGINPIDLYLLTQENITPTGPIVYTRRKTDKLYSVKIEPEAEELIKKYMTKESLAGGWIQFDTFRVKLNNYLNKLGVQLLGRPISSYYARHSWATIAYMIGIPEHIIAQGLGHSSAHPITNIYIRRNEAIVDEANRAIITALEEATAQKGINTQSEQQNA